MPSVTAGGVVISYQVRRSVRARRMRIVVTPGEVEVVAPRRAGDRLIEEFVDAKSRWLLEKTRALRDRSLEPLPPRFVDGARVLLRGRPLALRIEPADAGRGRVANDGALHVRLPRGLGEEEGERRARELVVAWLRDRALEDAEAYVARHAPKLGKRPRSLRIGDQKTLWGSCSPRDVVSLNWRLVAAPPEVFEYVVVHELCHLRERNHSPRFWRLVEGLVADYRERRAWLKEHGVGLG